VTTVATSAPTTWGGSRRWNSWVEFVVGNVPVASSATGNFALLGGKVTEDLSRGIRRDATVTLQFPTGQRHTTIPVFTPVAAAGAPFTIGTSSVGGSDTIGGGTIGVGAPLLTSSGATITDASGNPIYVGTEEAAPALEVAIPSTTAATRRSAYVPTSIGDLLDPNSGTEMRIWAGFEGEEVLLGHFDLVSTPVKLDAGGPMVQVTGQSFERRIQRRGFWEPYNLTVTPNPFGTTLVYQVLYSLLYALMPSLFTGQTVLIGAEIEPSPVPASSISYKPGDDPLAKIGDLMAVAGLEGGFTRDNRFVAKRSPVVSDFGTVEARWQFVDGENAAIATLNDASRTFSDENSYNGVIIEGTNHTDPNAAPVIYTLWNTNASSPTYFDPNNPQASPNGPRPKHVTSDLVKTTADASAVAVAELAKVLMQTDTVDAEVPANARIEMGHFARLASDGLGADGMYRVSRVVHDLNGAPAQVTLYRFQQV
jgi:hypothetical protein